MSFETMDLPALQQVAKDYEVKVSGRPSAPNIIKALEENGITYEDVSLTYGLTAVGQEKPTVEAEAESDEEQVLLKMDRENPLFEDRGYRFTKEHPFQVVKESDAIYFLQNYPGFRTAMPQEIKSYYN